MHHRQVYSEKADALILRIDKQADDSTRRALADRLYSDFNEYNNPDIDKLERMLSDMLAKIEADAKDRGFES